VRATLIVMVGGVLIAVTAGLAAWWMPRQLPPAAPPLFEAGVSDALAHDRATRVSSLRYVVSLSVPTAMAEPITGHLQASFDLRDASTPLAFDFAQPPQRLLAARAGDRRITPEWRNGHLVIAPGDLTAGRNVIAFDFLAGDQPLNRHEDYLYSLFVPARASLAMPLFDQPTLRARWRLSLTLPRAWTAVTNARETGRIASGDRTGWLFDETLPLPPYLMAFAAGAFSIETAERDGRTFRMFHRETDPAKVARNRDAIFDLHAAALRWMETYTGIGYAWGKFDVVLIPAFQFGGMEHPGSIFYNANALLLDPTATETQRLARANTIAHETAHQWFGDLVTMSWFDDVWMKEVFANFFADKIVNPSFPTVNHPLRFLVQNYPAAYDVDRTAGANPIRQPLANLADAGTLYGAIIYQKAPIVMRQLELLMGEDRLREGLRDYLLVHAFEHASWTDLVGLLDSRTPADLVAWSRAWVMEAGRPTIATDLRIEGGTIARLAIRQSDGRNRGVIWPQRLHVVIGRGSVTHSIDVTLDAAETLVPGAVGLEAPDWVLPTGGGLGYGNVQLDAGSRNTLLHGAHAIADPLTRASAFVTLWEAMLDGQIAPAAMRDELIAAVPGESDALLRQVLLDDLRSVFWRFTPAAERPALAARLEPVLQAGLGRATNTSDKAAWFATLRGIALGRPTLAWLEQVWRRERAIPGLPLSEIDESDLALDLAVRDVPGAEAILQEQLARITNVDRRARFAFLVPALSRDPATREAFADRLRNSGVRAHEAWVVDAVKYLHHPLRAEASESLVLPALALVRTIQQTGDIFFPKRWSDATLGGYQSPRVAARVQAFIDALPPDYPPRLRWVLQSAADPLFRAAALLSR
jgi:aminopeptidase N